MKYASVILVSCTNFGFAHAQPVDLRAGLPDWGVDSIALHYLPDRQGEHLPTIGDHWTWVLDSVNWMHDGQSADTVWHHSETQPPAQGGAFSVYDRLSQRYSFFHVSADTLVEDSAWVLIQGTTEVGYPPVPLCWQGEQVGGRAGRFRAPGLILACTGAI